MHNQRERIVRGGAEQPKLKRLIPEHNMQDTAISDLCGRIIRYLVQEFSSEDGTAISITYGYPAGYPVTYLQYSCNSMISHSVTECVDLWTNICSIETHFTAIPNSSWAVSNLGCRNGRKDCPSNHLLRQSIRCWTIACRLASPEGQAKGAMARLRLRNCLICCDSCAYDEYGVCAGKSCKARVLWFVGVVHFVNCADLVADVRDLIARYSARLLVECAV